MARVTAMVLSLALAAASSNTHKNIADTLRQFMTGYFRHYRAGYYVDDFISSDNECQRVTDTSNIYLNDHIVFLAMQSLKYDIQMLGRHWNWKRKH